MAAPLQRFISRISTRLYATKAAPVVHVPAKQRFEISFTDSEPAFLSYEKVGADFDLNSTVVPASKRGQGLAEQLATVRSQGGYPALAAFTFVKDSDAKAILSCNYLRDRFLPRNSQWKSIVKH